MSERGLELGTFLSRERYLNRSATAPPQRVGSLVAMTNFVDFTFKLGILRSTCEVCWIFMFYFLKHILKYSWR